MSYIDRSSQIDELPTYLILGRLVAISFRDTSVISGQLASTRVVTSGQYLTIFLTAESRI